MHSEDVHTGFNLRQKGWTLQYVPIVLAKGLSPDTLPAFFSQPYRWCSGSMSLSRSEKFRQTHMTLKARLCYLSGFLYYLHTGLFTLVTPLIPLVLGVFYPEAVKIRNVVWLTPALFFAFVAMPLWQRQKWTPATMAVKMTYGWAHLFAAADAVRGGTAEWTPTGTKQHHRTSMASRHRLFRTGLVVWGGGTAVTWVGVATYRTVQLQSFDFAFLLASGLIYGGTVSRVMFWTAGTKAHSAGASGSGGGEGKVIFLHPWGEIEQSRGGRVAAAALLCSSKGQRWSPIGAPIHVAMVAAAAAAMEEE